MAMSVTPILPNKQTLKLIGGSSFLRNGFTMKSTSAKRKSAVELLQESKAYYVKSEKVLDSKQEFKHSEHLQVSSNPNFDKLHIKVPTNHKVVTSTATMVISSTISTMTTTMVAESSKPPPPPPRRNDAKARVFEQKLFGVNNNDNNVHYHSNGPPVPVHHQQTYSSRNNGQSLLPPKSPHLSRPRSKTQPESAFAAKAEQRKCHREYVADDIQMKLRRLLNTDSRENLNGNLASLDLMNGNHHYNAIESCELEIPNGTKVGKTFITRQDPVLQPRHQQDGNYSIHKSMPDLSPTKLGVSRGTRGRPRTTCSSRSSSSGDSDTNPSGSLSVTAPKSTELQRVHSRTTSDYVSRSPSCKCEHLSGSGNDELSPRSQKVSVNGDSLIAVEHKGHPYYPLSPSTMLSSVCDHFGVDNFNGMTRRRPILRSKSDISHRFSRIGTDFIENGSSNKRTCRSNSDLERFFDCMGLDSSILSMLKSPPSNNSSPIFFASTSSISSSQREDHSNSNGSDGSFPITRAHSGLLAHPAPCRDSATMCLVPGLTNRDLLQHGPTETSIVERNARVIKWLYNCRKVNNADGNS